MKPGAKVATVLIVCACTNKKGLGSYYAFGIIVQKTDHTTAKFELG